jgi:hypothetical protein
MADLPNNATEPLPEGDSLYVTLSDDGQVENLVYTDETGIYLRGTGTWTPLETDASDDPIDGKVQIEVTANYVDAYDAARSNDDPIAESDVEQYRANVE